MVGTNINEVKNINKSNYLYVILTDVKLLKIGITDEPYKRFVTIQNASGALIRKYYLSKPLSNNYEIEQYMHKYFKKYNTVAEWYKNISFNDVVEYISNYIDKNGIFLKETDYVIVYDDSNNTIIDIDEYIEVFAKLMSYAKLFNLDIANDKNYILKMDELIFKYEETLYSTKNRIDKILELVAYENMLKKSIFILLNECGTKYILNNPVYYNFFKKYYNVEKVENLNSMKKVQEFLC